MVFFEQRKRAPPQYCMGKLATSQIEEKNGCYIFTACGRFLIAWIFLFSTCFDDDKCCTHQKSEQTYFWNLQMNELNFKSGLFNYFLAELDFLIHAT